MKADPETSRDSKDQRGLICPKCGCRHFRVIYTRARWGGRILRRRQCRHCGKRVTTFEQLWAQTSESQAGKKRGWSSESLPSWAAAP